MIVFWN